MTYYFIKYHNIRYAKVKLKVHFKRLENQTNKREDIILIRI